MKKKWLCSFALLLICSVMHAEEMNRSVSLLGRVIVDDQSGFFILEDGSCWKVHGFVVRWRGVKEWWNDVRLEVPENYKCKPSDWFAGASVRVYPKLENIEVDVSLASNDTSIKQATHMLVNEQTGQVLFALIMPPADCMVQIFNAGHEKGKTAGYNDGYSAGYRTGDSLGYSRGFSDGKNSVR